MFKQPIECRYCRGKFDIEEWDPRMDEKSRIISCPHCGVEQEVEPIVHISFATFRRRDEINLCLECQCKPGVHNRRLDEHGGYHWISTVQCQCGLSVTAKSRKDQNGWIADNETERGVEDRAIALWNNLKTG